MELLETLQALELAHRRSEFARARAEALATARYDQMEPMIRSAVLVVLMDLGVQSGSQMLLRVSIHLH